ncbi:MAG: bifunctional riboflavin kinase/FAD synthetase [Rickettsiaceae bacterium]|jgi:riboflavin kinase/FMN adenylyltransferase|nr:bifunctional riboflavin kinase/FAD synthetase [Rickettsiaceae bacterium]
MQVIRNFQTNHNLKPDAHGTVLTIGNFDGIHLGHQKILNQAREIAKKNNLKSALLTFEPHPTKIINPTKYCHIKINNLAGKLDFLRQKELADIVFITAFNQQMANLSPQDFVEKLMVEKLKIKHLIVGYDFVFGKNRAGNTDLLEELSKKYGFSFHKIEAIKSAGEQICSSTGIRKFLAEGNIKAASQMLGRDYQVSGIVIKGKELARTLGFPTANFLPKQNLIKPKFGVYKAEILVDGKTYKAILNFGIKPTFAGTTPLFEIHIFDFNQLIYGKKIAVRLLDFVREEKKFASVEELKLQIAMDCKLVQKN